MIIDASLALKWVIEEDGSTLARELLLRETLAAPDLITVECANVLWAKARRGVIARDLATAALAAILAAPVALRPTAGYAAQAQALAFELNQTAYDSLYLALALAEHDILCTADAAFAAAARRHPRYRFAVELLGM
ncbi:MAG TPA: type II toxin-antitoxin system VapC family toxin [Stellaceae bacterium]